MTIDDLTSMLATGFGLGYFPHIPGTAGALSGIILSVVISLGSRRTQLAAITFLLALAVPVCEHGSSNYAGSDDHRIVTDKFLAFPLATLTLPLRQHPGLLAGVFLTSRLLDGIKPPPARIAVQLPGGVGIVLDDIVTNLWSLLIWASGWWWAVRFLPRR
jgi:phosphatidylglycerophosphatase A